MYAQFKSTTYGGTYYQLRMRFLLLFIISPYVYCVCFDYPNSTVYPVSLLDTYIVHIVHQNIASCLQAICLGQCFTHIVNNQQSTASSSNCEEN